MLSNRALADFWADWVRGYKRDWVADCYLLGWPKALPYVLHPSISIALIERAHQGSGVQ